MVKFEVGMCLLAMLVGIYLLETNRSSSAETGIPNGSIGIHYTVYIDPAFNRQQTTIIEGALRQWETVISWNAPHFQIVRQSITCNSVRCPHAFAIHPDTQEHLTQLDHKNAIGLTYPGGNDSSNIYVATGLDNRNFNYVCLHEIAHSLGLDHDNNHPSIVCQDKWCMSEKITTADINQYQRVRGAL